MSRELAFKLLSEAKEKDKSGIFERVKKGVYFAGAAYQLADGR